MTRDKLKQLVKDVLIENSELALTSTSQQIDNSSTAEDFVKKLVGKKLKGLLDVTGYARLYILNKYGVGGYPEEGDIQANVANLMDNVTAFINFRKLDKLGKQRDDWDKEQYAKPEYKEWLKQRALAFKAYRDARDSNSVDADELRKKYQTVASSDPTLSDYRKMMADKETLVNQIHNTPLTLDDVLPRQDDTDSDKKRWSAVERSFNKLKNLRKENIMTKKELKELIREVCEELTTEALVTDSETSKLINDFGQLTDELTIQKERLKQLEAQHSELEEQIRTILEALENVEDKTLATEQYITQIARKGYSRENLKYKEAFNLALTKVNEATKRVLNEAAEATKGITKVASSIGIKRISEDHGVPEEHILNIEKSVSDIDLANKVLSRLANVTI